MTKEKKLEVESMGKTIAMILSSLGVLGFGSGQFQSASVISEKVANNTTEIEKHTVKLDTLNDRTIRIIEHLKRDERDKKEEKRRTQKLIEALEDLNKNK